MESGTVKKGLVVVGIALVMVGIAWIAVDEIAHGVFDVLLGVVAYWAGKSSLLENL